MKKVTVITGGAGGMGFATAKVMGKDHHVIISDINKDKLDEAFQSLSDMGISCSSVVCDISNKESVEKLVNAAQGTGEIASVIHTAGISPQMAGAEAIIKVNALGTIHIVEAFFNVAKEGFALVNVASMGAYLAPSFLMPKKVYAYAFSDKAKFVKQLTKRSNLMPNDFYKSGIAYSISKNFVIWYTKKNAVKFGEKGARILSVSPGTFDTEMGRLEEKSGSVELLEGAALKRLGRPEEVAELLAFCASEKASYMTGEDILCDGGVVAAKI